MDKYVCSICEYTYSGKIPFCDLPSDWVCPICFLGKEYFELIEE